MSLSAFRGVLLSEREENRYHDSYFHARYWDVDEGRPVETTYASTAWGGSTAAVPDVVRHLLSETYAGVRFAAGRYDEGNVRRALLEVLAYCVEHDAWDAQAHIGALVEVTKGRKVARGTRGRVMTIRKEVAHRSRHGTWITHRWMAMLDSGGSYPIVNLGNCKVIEHSAAVRQLMFDLSH